MEIKSFEDLECWKAGHELRKHISVLSRKFPKEEKYSLCDNLKRAARSVTNNIAEGYGRFHYQETFNSAGKAEVLYMKLLTTLL